MIDLLLPCPFCDKFPETNSSNIAIPALREDIDLLEIICTICNFSMSGEADEVIAKWNCRKGDEGLHITSCLECGQDIVDGDAFTINDEGAAIHMDCLMNKTVEEAAHCIGITTAAQLFTAIGLPYYIKGEQAEYYEEGEP